MGHGSSLLAFNAICVCAEQVFINTGSWIAAASIFAANLGSAWGQWTAASDLWAAIAVRRVSWWQSLFFVK